MSRSRISWLLPVLLMAGCEPFDPWFDYAADDPKLQHVGRMDFSTPDGPTYAHPGTTIRFRCNCTGVDVAFNDLGEGGEKHTNWVNVVVDGETKAKVELRQGPHILRGAHNLPKGEHIIELVKRTEAYTGDIQFLGISLQGVLLEPPPRPGKRIEIIGDSITCGYGNEVDIYAPNYTEPNTGYHSKNEDISQAYGLRVGRKLNAETVITCFSGRGIYRNLDGTMEGKTMPYLYPRIFPERETPLWDPTLFVPDVIVINLGTNDFSVADDTQLPSAPPAEAFKETYKAFVRQLRELYPSAKIVCSVGPMVNDNYPPGRKLWTTLRRYVSEVVDSLSAEGVPEVHYFAYTPIKSDPYGEDWHPTSGFHAQMAEELAPFLKGLGL